MILDTNTESSVKLSSDLILFPKSQLEDFSIGDGRQNSSLSATEDNILSVYLVSVWLISIYANGVIVLGLSRQKGPMQALDMLMKNLALSNGLLALTTYPLMVGSLIYHEWIFGIAGCLAYSFISMFFGLVSVWTLLGIAGVLFTTIKSRSNAMTKTLQNKYRLGVFKFLLIAYTICLTLCVLPLIGVGEYGFGKHGTSCTINWNLRTLTSTIYLFCLFTGGFFIPLLGIMAFYLGILMQFRAVNKSPSNPHHARKWTLVKRKTLLMALSVGLCVMLCWTPYATVSMWQSFGDSAALPARFEAAAALLAKSSTAAAPLVHLWFTKKFRHWFQAFLCCLCFPGEPEMDLKINESKSQKSPTRYSHAPASFGSMDKSHESVQSLSPNHSGYYSKKECESLQVSRLRTQSTSSGISVSVASYSPRLTYMNYIDRIVNREARAVFV